MLELSDDSTPEFATYHGYLADEPSFSVSPASDLITTSTSQAPPEKEECYLKIKLHPTSAVEEWDDQGNSKLVQEVTMAWEDLVDVRRLPGSS
jgi:hypothetical protein